jgi:hypothetical protein
MEYRCEATSVAGFIQQLAVSYIGRGYFFYVVGEIPERKDPRVIDQRLIEKYGLGIGKATRSRRKAAGLANIQYLRFQRSFVLLATQGKHPFFDREGSLVRDAREVPIKFGGYAISYRDGHPHVRIEQTRYLEMKAYLSQMATHRSRGWIERSNSESALQHSSSGESKTKGRRIRNRLSDLHSREALCREAVPGDTIHWGRERWANPRKSEASGDSLKVKT